MTIQHTLFPDERPPKIARDSDPDTSHDAAAEMLPTLSTLEGFMLESFAVCGPQTANEAAEFAGILARGCANHETLRKRYTGLLAKSRITSDGKKKCNITGKLATVYRIKDD